MSKVSAEDSKWTHFSVTYPVKLDGKKHVPCVCYPIASAYRQTVFDLAKAGTAMLFEKPVRFLSGKVLEETANEASKPYLVVPSEEVKVNSSSVPEFDEAQ